nr:protein srg1 [Quercus suber]
MASMEPVSSWNSNSVLSVMELTKEPMTVVPKNYIRPDQELSAPSDYSTLTTIPTIDMKKLALGETSDLELEKLHSTCKAWGLIQLANHGVSSSLLEKLKHEIEEFFMLPSEEKMKYKARPGDVEGYGTIIRCNDQTLDWGDRFYMTLNPIQKRKPYLFPELPSSLRNILEAYISELQKLAMTLLDSFVVNVGDVMEILSNGAFTSIEHRVTVNSDKERISLAMFFNPKLEAEIGPATSTLSPRNPPLFKRITMEDYVKDFFSRNLNGKSHLENMRIKSGEPTLVA